jgi:hypothetical protein
MSLRTAIHTLVSRPTACAAHLKVVLPSCSLSGVACAVACHCSPANADEAPVVRSLQLATAVLRCWPIRTLRLRTQGHQRTNTTDVPCWDAKVLGCVPAVHCAANLRGLASSFAHDWATASLLHVSNSVLVHSLLHVARTAKYSAFVRCLDVPVVCGYCCRDDRQRAPNTLFRTLAHTVVGQQASLASATAQHAHHQLAYLVDRRTLETHAIGLVGCVVVPLSGGAYPTQRTPHALFLEWLAQNLHRIRHRSRQYYRHPNAREQANDVSYFVPCCSPGCSPTSALSCSSAAEPVSPTLAATQFW